MTGEHSRLKRGLSGFRAELPEVLLEAASVLFAVVCALWVDEWRESRDRIRLAVRATEAVAAEIRANHDEVADNLAANEALLERVREARGDSVRPVGFNLEYSYSLVSPLPGKRHG